MGRSGIARTARSRVSLPTATPRWLASRAPARPATANPIAPIIARCTGVRRAHGCVRFGICSAKVCAVQSMMPGEEAADLDIDHDWVSASCGVGELSSVPGMSPGGFTAAARTLSPLASGFGCDADGGTDPPDTGDNDIRQMGSSIFTLSKSHADDHPCPGQRMSTTRPQSSRKVRQIHFHLAIDTAEP